MWWKTFKMLHRFLWPAIVSWWFVLACAFGMTRLLQHINREPEERFLDLVRFAMTTTAFAWIACALLAAVVGFTLWATGSPPPGDPDAL